MSTGGPDRPLGADGGNADAGVAVVPLLGAFSAKFAGISVTGAFRSPQLQARAQIAAFEAFEPDAMFPFMDLTAQTEAVGANLRWSDGDGPVVDEPIDAEALGGALQEHPVDRGRLGVFRSVIGKLREALPSDCAVGCYVCGPWSLVCSAVGLAEASRLVRRSRGLIGDLLGGAADLGVELISRFADAGAGIIMLLEPCVGGGILGPDEVSEMVLSPIGRMVEACHRQGTRPVLHICGDAEAVLPALTSLEAAALSLDAPVDLLWAREQLGGDICLWGNVAPVETLMQKSADAVGCECERLVEQMGEGGDFVLSSGCEVPVSTPVANIRAMVDAAG